MTTNSASSLPPLPHRGEVVDRHPCPTCGASVHHIHRPGRARVYCTNACRQRAYRWRRAHGVRYFVERDGPAERSIANGRRHALRDRRDPVARLTDRNRREVTACGTFARPARLARFTHYDFLPDHPWSCDTCIALVGGDPDQPSPVPPWPTTSATAARRG